MSDAALIKLVKVIREASYDYWHTEKTLGCDSRGLAPAKHIAQAIIAAITDEQHDLESAIQKSIREQHATAFPRPPS